MGNENSGPLWSTDQEGNIDGFYEKNEDGTLGDFNYFTVSTLDDCADRYGNPRVHKCPADPNCCCVTDRNGNEWVIWGSCR